MESIMKSGKCCFFCGRTSGLERHHAMHGTANRRKAESLGLWTWLCADCHRGTDGVHGKNGRDKDLTLMRAAEYSFLKNGHTLEDWMKEFGKNYLDI